MVKSLFTVDNKINYKTFNNQNVNNQILFHNILTVSQYFNEELTIFSHKEEE